MDYFAYASNLSREQMRQRCPNAKPKFSAVLPNYKLIFTGWAREWHGGKANIIPFKGAKVAGAVYEVSEQELRMLDRFENYPGTYTHLNVMVFNEDDVAVKAVTYVKARQEEEAKPSPEYVAIIKKGYKDWELE
jgi:gamma-glutamylcyclotransferase